MPRVKNYQKFTERAVFYTRAQKLAHISYGLLHKHPWRWEVCAWQVWTKMFQRWGPFLKNMYLTLCQFSKKNLIRYVLWKISNFALIFYVMSVLHKKSKQSLRPSTGRIGWDFFSKNWHGVRYIFFKKGPQLWNNLAFPCHAQSTDCQGCLWSKL